MERFFSLRIFATGGVIVLALPGIGHASSSAKHYSPVTLKQGTAIHATLEEPVTARHGEKVSAVVTTATTLKTGNDEAVVIPRGTTFAGFYDTKLSNGKRVLVWTHLEYPNHGRKNLVQYDRTTANGYRVGHSDFVSLLGANAESGPVSVVLERSVSLVPVKEKALPKPPKPQPVSVRMPGTPQALSAVLKAAKPGKVRSAGATFVPTLPKPPAAKAYHRPRPPLPMPPSLPPRPPMPSWSLAKGHPLGVELAAWAQRAGWDLHWNVKKDWTVPRATTLHGHFCEPGPHGCREGVAGQVIEDTAEQLVEEGKRPIRAQFYKGNKTVVVKRAGGNP